MSQGALEQPAHWARDDAQRCTAKITTGVVVVQCQRMREHAGDHWTKGGLFWQDGDWRELL